jgi:hypothetical protein
MITYEDTDEPRIAIAPSGFDPTFCASWVRSHDEPMMLQDLDGHWILFFFAANGSVQFESVAFWQVTDMHEAARMMRIWLDRSGLLPETPTAD